ncbi:Conjugative relaxase domain protein [Thiomonas sp. X19]|uniref:MobF family relaxase n=1 Tax=Thiomonas sp. X19 TaxID=1050370 RepID=UPI000B6D8FAC|nr:MobF family relaxase [Thiomonas sp. X19]SCC94401.1 Conjugative relaxase domain protein [Thiomonas sp. X19]
MISRSAISSPQGASSYYTSQARAAEYYSGEAVPSAWSGAAAAAMGLSGKVDPQALTNILQGRVIERDPATGEARERQLGRVVHGEHQHRAGQDFTISAPKSVSLEALVHGRDEALQAHRNAVAEALKYLEDHASQSRIRGEYVATDGLAIATFEHVSTRAQDPQLHTHALIANVTFHNGRAYSLSNEKLLEHRSAADAVYHNTLSRELQKAGYQITHNRDGHVEIAGYTRDHLRDFSQRSQEIERALAARGLTRDSSSAEARNIAALSTRSAKELPEVRAAHIDRWQAQAQALGIKAAQLDPGTTRETLSQQTPQEAARQAVDAAKAHLTEREFVMRPQDLYQQAARFSAGTTTQAALEKEIERQVRGGELLRDASGRLTTAEAIASEKRMDASLQAGKGMHESVMTPREFDHALQDFEQRKGFVLSDEQRAAARMILTGDDRFQGVQGLAGTGKTTMLELVREAAEAKGWSIVGHSNGSEQAAKMEQESGIRSTTTAAHLLEESRANRDRELAAVALETQRADPKFNIDPYLYGARNLQAQVKHVSDSTGNRYAEIKGQTYSIAAHSRLQHQDPGLGERESVNSAGVFQQAQAGERWTKAEGMGAMLAHARIDSRVKDGQQAEVQRMQAVLAPAHKREIRIMDEASQSGQKQFNKAIKTTEQAGARTVFLGDKTQHQSVEAGRAFELSQKHLRPAELGEASIRRQTTQNMKDAVHDVLQKRYNDAIKRIDVREIRTAQDKLGPSATREEKRAAALEDNKAVINLIAKEYGALKPEERAKVLVITSTNGDRISINQAIRDELKARGELGKGVELKTLEKVDMTEVEAKRASSYSPGWVIQTTTKTKALDKGALLEIVKADSRTNTITARDTAGRDHIIDPNKTQLKTYTPERRELGAGDKVKFTDNHRLQVAGRDAGPAVRNGQIAHVEAVSEKTLTLRLGEGEKARVVEVERAGALKLEHAYSTTSQSAQGQTANPWMHHNTESGKHGDRETGVNFTRAVSDAKLFTQDIEKASRQMGVELQKTSAHDVLPTQPARGEPTQRNPDINPQPSKDLTPDRAPEREREHGYW